MISMVGAIRLMLMPASVVCRQGAQGILDHASHAQLDSEFGTHRDDDVVKKILETGEMQTSAVRSAHPAHCCIRPRICLRARNHAALQAAV